MFEASTRAAALEAALAELQQWGVDRFSIEGAAHRCRLEPEYFRQTWNSERQLIIDALLSYGRSISAQPDTGSLHGDLTELALTIASYLNEPAGRRLARMMVIDSKSHGVDFDTRVQFWAVRERAFGRIVDRAVARGELSTDVDTKLMLQLLTSPLHAVALYSDRPLQPEYCRAIADLVTRAVSSAPPN